MSKADVPVGLPNDFFGEVRRAAARFYGGVNDDTFGHHLADGLPCPDG
ncbi:MAG: hypothetical protein AAF802_28770 [Planctomycetota bacterium]